MHINSMRAGLERGEPQIGTWLTMVRNPAILSLMKSAGLDFARVDMEHTALTIEHIADEGRYDMVVVGSRGLGALGRMLEGSVSEHVATHARRTVVVVH